MGSLPGEIGKVSIDQSKNLASRVANSKASMLLLRPSPRRYAETKLRGHWDSEEIFIGGATACMRDQLMLEESTTSRLVLVLETDPDAQLQLGSMLANLGYEPVVVGSL